MDGCTKHKRKNVYPGSTYTSTNIMVPYQSTEHNRTSIITLCRLRFEHNCTPFHLHRIQYTDQPTCHRDDISPADPKHLILSCPKFISQRTTLLNVIDTHGIPQPIHIPQLLTTPHPNIITKHVLQYINTSNMEF